MATWRDDLAALLVDIDTRIYQNTTRDITGTVHQLEDHTLMENVYNDFLPMDGDNTRVVRTTGAPTTNATSLSAAYTAALSLTPNGAALSENNRVTILLQPGVYDMGVTPFLINNSYIDLVGLGAREQVVITSQVLTAGQGTIYQTINGPRYANLTIENTAQTIVATTSADASAYAVNAGYDTTIFQNVYFKVAYNVAWPMRLGQGYPGTFEGCRFGSRAFQACTGVGTVRYCVFSDGPVRYSSGTGIFEFCALNDGAFEGNTGTFQIRHCTFGSSAFYFAIANPTTQVVEYCNFGNNAYWNGGRAGVCRHCTFSNNTYNALSSGLGTFIHCSFGPGMGATDFAGKLDSCVWDMGAATLLLAEGAIVIGTTVTTTDPVALDAGGPVNAVIAACRLSGTIGVNITNDVTTPFNVIDTAIA